MNPKSVLGFYATVVGLLFTAAVGLISALAWSNVSTWLIPWVALFAALMFVLVVTVVVVINVKRPQNLMLLPVTGTEYVAIEQTTLGDSLVGESVRVPGTGLIELPSGEASVESTEEGHPSG